MGWKPPDSLARTSLENELSKIIVITGAGLGLGRALARRFGKDGETVVLLGRTLAKVEAAAVEIGERAMAVECDVGSPDSVRSAFAKIAERHPKIDVLINNAAVYEPFLISEATDAQIIDPITINLMGTIFCAREAAKMMGRGGYIINVGSESAEMRYPYLSIYQATKVAVDRFSKSLMEELEPEGIRVTLVSAGAMYEEGKSWTIDPERTKRFAMACIAAGLNNRERPISHVDSVTGVFRALLDLPQDVQIEKTSIHARARD